MSDYMVFESEEDRAELARRACAKYVATRDCEVIEPRFEAEGALFVVARDGDCVVFASSSIVDEFHDGPSVSRGQFERAAMRWLMDNPGRDSKLRADDMQVQMLGDTGKAFIRYAANVMGNA